MTPPDLTSYDVILVNSSAGKDSQASLDVTVEAARAAGVLDRLVVVHADLGRVEWPGTRGLAAEHAAHYGLPFETVRNGSWRDLLHRIEGRGMWPGMATRFCTSEFKTGQVRTLMTALVKLHRQRHGLRRGSPPVRILNVLGLRAQESPKRAKKLPFSFDKASSNGLRHVDEWLPIHDWTVEQVWARIEKCGTRVHRAYSLGMPRLSCVFCVFASKPALLIAAKHNPELAADYAAVEIRMGHRFRQDLSIADVAAEAAALNDTDEIVAPDWAA